MNRQVVITGMGLLSCAGASLAEAREVFLSGECRLSPIEHPDAEHLKARFAGLLKKPLSASALPPGWELFDKHVVMALIAAREALSHATVQPSSFGRGLGLIFATCSGPMLRIEEHYARLNAGDPRLTPEQLHAKRYYSGAKVLAHALDVRGLTTTVVTACTASTGAIALAADLIRCGLLDAALAGGADAFALSTLAGFDGLKATSETRCAPFSKPVGLNLGEAAAFVFLESAESAVQRGSAVQAHVLASGTSNDAYHCSAPDPSGRGVAAAIQRALAQSGLQPDDIHYVNAHGTGTEANDRSEVKALRRVFGARVESLPVSSTKSQIGHCLGAAGAAEVIASIVCAQKGVFPSTANFTEPREGCGLNAVPEAGQPWTAPRTFLSTNAAFGGHNAALALSLPGERDNHADAPRTSERIFVTGCGVITTAGIGLDALHPLDARDNATSPQTAGEIPEPPPRFINESAVEQFDRRLDLRGMDRSSRWATVAAKLALRQSGLPEKPAMLSRLGLFLNLAAGPSEAESEFLTSYFANDRRVVALTPFPYIVPCSVAGNVCRALRLTGHNFTLSGGPHAGLLGLAPAWSALRCGQTQTLLCGAVDELTDRILSDERAAGRLAQANGITPGEGAAVLMLETEAYARSRNAPVLAELCSVAVSTETSHPHLADADTGVLRQTVEEAMQRAGVSPSDVQALCLAGSRERLDAALAAQRFAAPVARIGLAKTTGELEAAQPLVDVCSALACDSLPPGAVILVASTSAHGTNGAAVFRKAD